jgi:hypothetical protein
VDPVILIAADTNADVLRSEFERYQRDYDVQVEREATASSRRWRRCSTFARSCPRHGCWRSHRSIGS